MQVKSSETEKPTMAVVAEVCPEPSANEECDGRLRETRREKPPAALRHDVRARRHDVVTHARRPSWTVDRERRSIYRSRELALARGT